MSKLQSLKEKLAALGIKARVLFKTPRRAFLSGVALGTLVGKPLLSLIF